MSYANANRLPRENERVVVDRSHHAHGGKRGVVRSINDKHLAGPWYTIRFDGVPGKRAHSGVVHGNYLIVDRGGRDVLVDVPVRRAPFREWEEEGSGQSD